MVTASDPIDTGVTMYRAPGAQSDDGEQNPTWLSGYALITETRDVDLPAGPAVIRFPGVAAGMLAESVVVSGLPAGVHEKNLDAQLLSPRNLYAGWYGRPVLLRRTDLATGKASEEPAVIRSAPDGAAIVETAKGFEAVQCGGTQDALSYPGVPEGLYTRPTLSIATDAPAPAHVRLKVTYLAWNFDWRANYVLHLSPDLTHARLSAWVTLANADVTSFAHAQAAVVAGRPNFSETHDQADDEDQELTFHCQARVIPPPPEVAPPPVMMMAPPPAPMAMMRAMDVVVTARKAVSAVQENLGDLKLYRLPQPTTVASRSRKQVALFDPRSVRVAVVHSAALDDPRGDQAQFPAALTVRARNNAAAGLGLALPGGGVRVMLDRGAEPLVVGQGSIEDRAVNDRIEIATAQTPNVIVNQTITHRGKGWHEVTAKVTNANPFAVNFLGTFRQTPPGSISQASGPLTIEDGHKIWQTRIAPGGHATLRWRVSDA